MKKLCVICLLLLGIASPTFAQTSTPIPWPTPTPWPTTAPEDRPFNLDEIDFVDQYADAMEVGVNTWQSANQSGTVDLLLSVILLLIVLYGLYSIYRRVEEL